MCTGVYSDLQHWTGTEKSKKPCEGVLAYRTLVERQVKEHHARMEIWQKTELADDVAPKLRLLSMKAFKDKKCTNQDVLGQDPT